MPKRGRKPKDWFTRWIDSVRTATWAYLVAQENDLPMTGYALCKHFNPPEEGQTLTEWNEKRPKTWDHRLAGNAGFPRKDEFLKVSPEYCDSFRISNHVIWDIPSLRDDSPANLESLMRRIDPDISRRFLPGKGKRYIWLDRCDLALEAAKWVSLEANLDAVAALLIAGRSLGKQDPEMEIQLGMYAYGVLLRVCAFEKLENTIVDIADVLFNHIRNYDVQPPQRNDTYFFPWVPSIDLLDVYKTSIENRKILNAISPLVIEKPNRKRLERLLYWCDVAPRQELLDAVDRVLQENISTVDEASSSIWYVDHFYNHGLQHGLFEYYLAWWMGAEFANSAHYQHDDHVIPE